MDNMVGKLWGEIADQEAERGLLKPLLANPNMASSFTAT